MKRYVNPPSSTPAAKDENGAYLPNPPVVGPPSIDDKDEELSPSQLLSRGLLAIQRTLKALMHDINASYPSPPPRETVMSLKDVMVMLHELRKREEEVIEDMPDEELKKALSK